jgi:predicted small lipoprotein YifL
MKTIRSFLLVILLGASLSGCGNASQQPATPLGESMKGYELYSWQDGGQWKFSLLVGTNREKTLEEIKSADIVLSSVDALQAKLEEIPAGQYITWSSRETLSFPPDDIVQQVEQTCKDKGLILSVAS